MNISTNFNLEHQGGGGEDKMRGLKIRTGEYFDKFLKR